MFHRTKEVAAAFAVGSTVMLTGSIPLSSSAHADWWSRNFAPIGKGVEQTFHSIVKNPVEVLPVCWGAPQECRGKAQNGAVQTAAAQVSVSYRVDCQDRDTGADRADNTVTVTALNRDRAVAEINRLAQTTDLCQSNGDASRVTVPGSGRFLN